MLATRFAPSGIRDPQGMGEGHGIEERGGEHIYITVICILLASCPPQQVPGRHCFETFLELGAGVVFVHVFRAGVVFGHVFRGVAVMGSSFQCKMQCNAMQCILLLILFIRYLLLAMRFAPSGIRDPQGMREGHGIGEEGRGTHIYIYIYC